MPPEPHREKKIGLADCQHLIKISHAIDLLFTNDSHLLVNNSSERSICHKFAQYLDALYTRLDVDCEYNLNANSQNGNMRKSIKILIDEYRELINRQRQIQEFEYNQGYLEIGVFPDIIIHERGSNSNNTAIIEVKKLGATLGEIQYDQKKLKCYTSHDSEFFYPVGYLITLPTGSLNGCKISIEKYDNGRMSEKIQISPNIVLAKIAHHD